jgi:glycosyltransferase involved in cell wall biosynthesis
MKVSVLIPTRNRSELLQKAVASVLAQSFTDFELIIVNDGSQPLPHFSDSRIRTLNSSEAGAVPARNMAAAAARGIVLGWLDDDDQWSDRDFLRDAVTAIDEGADFVFGDGRFVFSDGSPSQDYSRNADAKSLEHDNTILVSAIVYRANLHTKLEQFDDSLPFYWDWDWYLRVARSGAKLHHIARPVVDILIHPQNMSGDSNAGPRQKDLDRLAEKHRLPPLKLKTHLDLA